jgi:uncharacterized protein with ACT and thioredoxin-like domain
MLGGGRAGRLREACPLRSAEEDGLDLGVEDEDESATGASDDVGEGALEEGAGAFVSENLFKAVSSVVVHLVGAARVHHESATHGVKRVRDDASADGNALGEAPHGEHGSSLGVGEEHGLARVEHTEVGRAVGDDADDGDAEASVETLRTVLGEDLLEAVDKTSELAVTALTDVSGEAGSGEIERVHDGQGGRTSGTTGRAVSEEELDGLLLGVVRVEDGLVEVLEGEVEGLGGEVTHNVGEVSSPEGAEALLLDDSAEAVTDAVVAVLFGDGSGSVLHLEEELDSLDGGDEGLRDGGGDTTDQEIGHEALLALGRGSGGGHLQGCV